MPGGNLESMTSTDKQGVLDKYFYSYDNSGLISGIDRNRRGLDKVSGRYEYSYDAIGRLTKTTHDGITKAAYEYDAFGNRTSMSEADAKTSYTYDVLDRLVEAKELNNSQAILKTYDYDKRGNQTKEFINGLLQKAFTFDATNMLSKVVDKDKGELENFYNGLGFRVASVKPEERIEYLCDLSRDYYNLLERTVNGETESFVYDNNVISMSKGGNNFYYLQDELGSPMYMTGTDGAAVSAYAFDDFGRNIDPFTGKRKKHGYTKQGNIIQPFAFTGYQEDEISGLKFAQVRYYSADTGRFQSEDNVKGFIGSPFTLNHYGYCFDNPIVLVDNDGNWPKAVESSLKVITGVITAAAFALAVGIVTIGSSGTGTPLMISTIAAGAGTGGIISGLANEENGGSYINGWVGGAVTGGIQTYLGITLGPLGTIIGGAANGVGSAITDVLDNIDKSVEKKKTGKEILRSAVNNSINGMINSIPAALIQWFTTGIDVLKYLEQGIDIPLDNNTAVEMGVLTDKFARWLGQIVGNIDNFLIAYEEGINFDWYGWFTGEAVDEECGG